MRLKSYTTALLVLAAFSASQSSFAAFNIYKKDGLQLDLSGQLYAEYTKDSSKFTNQYATNHYNYNTSAWEDLLVGVDNEEEDRRSRLGYDNNSSWLNIRGTQQIERNMSVTGNLQIGYSSGDYLTLRAANISLNNPDWGSISVGKQWFHSVTRTGTYYPVDYYAGNSVRVDFERIPNLTVSAYHIFPSRDDTRQTGYNVVQGNGLSADYIWKFNADHTLRVGAAVSQNEKNPPANVMWTGRKNTGGVVSAEYKFSDLTLSADYGKTNERFENSTLARVKSSMFGVKAQYDVTPVLSFSAAYGQKVSKKTGSDGVVLDSYSNNGVDYVDASTEEYLFSKVDQKRYYVQADYEFRENIRFYGKVQEIRTQNYRGDIEFTKRKRREISAGVSFRF